MRMEEFSSFGRVKVRGGLVFSGVEEVRMEGLQILGCRTVAIDAEDGEQVGESCSFDLQLSCDSDGVLESR